jgi:hypothetical protein
MIEQRAAAGDQEAALFLRLDRDGYIEPLYAKDGVAIVNGQPVLPSESREVDRHRSAVAWRTAMDARVPLETRVQYLEYFINGAKSLFSSNYNRALKDDKTRQLIVQTPSLLAAVERRIGTDIDSAVADLSDPQAQGQIVFNNERGFFEVPLIAPGQPVTDSARQQAFSAVQKLNQAVSAQRTIGNDVDSLVNDAFERIAGKKKTASIQDVLGRQGTEQTPNNRRGTISRTDGATQERAYDAVMAQYFDMSRKGKDGLVRPKLLPGKTAKDAEQALRAVFADGGTDLSSLSLEEAANLNAVLDELVP